ncbi:MAG: DUF2863 family protein [Nitrosomonadaceae bacterium]|nr:DUF2863 family protein [Nitrosomonadaceae bacterium]
MKKPHISRRAKSPRAIKELIRLAIGLAASGSRTEDIFWEDQLGIKINAQLRTGDDQNLETTLDQLYDIDPVGYGEFIYAIEAEIECSVITKENSVYDVLMFAIPILAWSRFSIPSGPVSKAITNNLRIKLQLCVLAKDVKFTLTDYLFSPDQLPRGYHLTHELASKLWMAAVAGEENLHMNPRQLAETGRFLSDTRYLIGAVAVPQGKPMFRWQENNKASQIDSSSIEKSLKQGILHLWQSQGEETLRSLFPGCTLELLLPDGFFSAWRMADRLARPYSMHASIDFIQSTLNTPASALHAIIAEFRDQWLEEYRISFVFKGRNDVLYGIVWALVGEENENSDTVEQIKIALQECGVIHTTLLGNHFSLEYCDECGAPLFPNPEGEIVHADFPEEIEKSPIHLH